MGLLLAIWSGVGDDPAGADEEPGGPAELSGWNDPSRVWPDPVAESQLGAEATYYLFTRADGVSLLPTPSPQRPLSIYVGGDSLSGGAAFGFERLLDDDVRYVVTTEVRLSTGVVTEWYFDWVAHLQNVVANGGYDVVVLSMGGNDAQQFRGHRGAVGSDQWLTRYRDRLTAMLAALERPGRLVVWVGMPAMSRPTLKELPDVVNPVASEVAGAGRRSVYVDASAIVSPDGVFTRRIETPDGTTVEVREGDGVHYTRDGGELLAAQVLAEVAARSG